MAIMYLSSKLAIRGPCACNAIYWNDVLHVQASSMMVNASTHFQHLMKTLEVGGFYPPPDFRVAQHDLIPLAIFLNAVAACQCAERAIAECAAMLVQGAKRNTGGRRCKGHLWTCREGNNAVHFRPHHDVVARFGHWGHKLQAATGLGRLRPGNVHPQVERAGHLRRRQAQLLERLMQVVSAAAVVLLHAQPLQ